MSIRIDAEAYIDTLGFDIKTSGKNIMHEHIGIPCPLCGDDHDYHMNIKYDLTHCQCWRCDYKSFDTMKTVSEVLEAREVTYTELLEIANEFPMFEDEMQITEEEIDEQTREAKFNYIWNTFSYSMNNFYRIYLSNRGITKSFTDKWGFKRGVSEGKIKYHGRVIIPIRDVSGKIVNFTGRSVYKDPYLRYKNCPSNRAIVPGKACLYGLYESLGKDRIVITEGPIDTVKLLQYDIGAVALLKKCMTKEQLDLLSDTFKRKTKIFISLDSEGTSEQDWNKIRDQVSELYKSVKFLKLKGVKDIGDCNEDQIRLLKEMISK